MIWWPSMRSTSISCKRSTAAPMPSLTTCSREPDEPAPRLVHAVVAVISSLALVGQHVNGAAAVVGMHALPGAAWILGTAAIVRGVQRLQPVLDVRVRVVRGADLRRRLRHRQHRR